MRVITKGMSDVPFYVAKQFKASMTGVTHLKEYSYNSRHLCGPGYQSLPDGSIIKKPPLKKIDAKPKARNKSCHGNPPDLNALLSCDTVSSEVPGIPQEITDRPPFDGYTLRKAVIRNRILNYSNVIRTAPGWKKRVLFFWTVTFPEGTADN